jgi:PPOX class probable F420-dependent enzyme
MKRVPANLRDLLADETRSIAFLATLMPDGSPQVTPVWFNIDGEYLLVNSARGRVKDKNMRARPRVAVSIMSMDDMYRYIQLRGEVIEINEEGGANHIHALSKKYRGRMYDIPDGEIRVTYKIKLDN